MLGDPVRSELRAVDPACVAFATGAGLLTAEIVAKTGVSMAYVGGIFVAAGFLIGSAAPIGGTVGLVIHDLLRGALGYSTLVVAAWILSFAGVLVWLTGPISNTSERPDLRRMRGAAPTDLGLVLIAGVHATAFAAWAALVVGWQRFYVAAIGFLPGVVAAVAVCVLVVVSASAVGRLGLRTDRTDPIDSHSSEPSASRRTRSAGRTGMTAASAFAIGIGWLGGASALDVFAHDLGTFTTTSQLRAFVTGSLGTELPIATVGKALVVGVYQYGELAVLLSAPVAALALWGWDTYRDQILSSIAGRIKMLGGVAIR